MNDRISRNSVAFVPKCPNFSICNFWKAAPDPESPGAATRASVQELYRSGYSSATSGMIVCVAISVAYLEMSA